MQAANSPAFSPRVKCPAAAWDAYLLCTKCNPIPAYGLQISHRQYTCFGPARAIPPSPSTLSPTPVMTQTPIITSIPAANPTPVITPVPAMAPIVPRTVNPSVSPTSSPTNSPLSSPSQAALQTTTPSHRKRTSLKVVTLVVNQVRATVFCSSLAYHDLYMVFI